MAKRRSDTLELGDGDDKVVITSEALGYEQSEDLLPEIMQIVSSVFETVAPLVASGEMKMDADVSKLLPVLGVLARQIGGGKLRRLAPHVLAGTTVLMADPDNSLEKIQLHLVKVEDRAMCFEARPDLYFAILWFAGKVTFGRFFPGGGGRSKKAPLKVPAE